MRSLLAALLFALLSAIGLWVIWQVADRLQGWAVAAALLWLVVVSKLAAITLAVRDSRSGD